MATDGGLTIPKAVYQDAEARLRAAYAIEIGSEHTSGDERQVRGFTRDETIERYAAGLRFWASHLPEIVPGIGMDVIATHAICSNATRMLTNKCEEYGILSEVENELERKKE